MGAAAAILLATLGAANGAQASGPCVALRTAAPGWQSGEADDAGPHVRVTHSYPRWPWPAVYESSRPAFLVRLNRLVEPQQVLGLVQITTDERSWRKPQWELLHCLTERRGNAGYTTVVFRLAESLPAGIGPTWMVADRQWSLGRTERPEALNGAYLYNGFRTYDPEHPVGSADSFWNHGQLVQTHGEALTQQELRQQQATLGLLRTLGLLPSPADVPQPVPASPRDACAEFNRNRSQLSDDEHMRRYGCPRCPCACVAGKITCAPCARCEAFGEPTPTPRDEPDPPPPKQ